MYMCVYNIYSSVEHKAGKRKSILVPKTLNPNPKPYKLTSRNPPPPLPPPRWARRPRSAALAASAASAAAYLREFRVYRGLGFRVYRV